MQVDNYFVQLNNYRSATSDMNYTWIAVNNCILIFACIKRVSLACLDKPVNSVTAYIHV